MGVPNKKTRTKTRRHLRDLDQIISDIKDPKHLEQHKALYAEEDLPGLGQHYCVECAKWFESDHSLVTHRKGKTHKRRVKDIKEGPYTQKDAEAAVGLRTDNGTRSTVTRAMEVEMENVSEVAT